MTANQLTYWANQEQKRHNLATEGETYRSNVTKERETHRSNVANEGIQRDRQIEDARHNVALEGFEDRKVSVAEYKAPHEVNKMDAETENTRVQTEKGYYDVLNAKETVLKTQAEAAKARQDTRASQFKGFTDLLHAVGELIPG